MRARNGFLLALVCLSVASIGAYLARRGELSGIRLPTGKYLHPGEPGALVGSFPCNLAASPDGRYIAVTTSGSRQQLSILDAATGMLLDKVTYDARKNGALYYGLAFDANGILLASNGPADRIDLFQIEPGGHLKAVGEIRDFSGVKDEPYFVSGLAVSPDGKRIYAAHNEAYRSGAMQSSLSILDRASGSLLRKVDLPGFPLAVAADANRVYATCERDGVVASIDPESGHVDLIKTGTQPTGLLLDAPHHRLFVANAGSDTVSIVDTLRDRVSKTILVRPAALRGLPGTTPLGMALSEDGNSLFVALGDMNAAAVIDLRRSSLRGYLPVGWYPTSVVRVGKNLFVANAKGEKGRNPNGPALKGGDSYVHNVIHGTVSKVDLPSSLEALEAKTRLVLEGNLISGRDPSRASSKGFFNPGIKHVVYVIKENRTYDQVLGDLDQGNGDKQLVMFGKEVTPNHHHLAERFGLFDNFNVCGEVSADGWQWATAGMASEYSQRNVPFNYSGRGRDYDFEGQTNGVTTDYAGLPDVAEVPGGHLWDACLRQGISFRNYGFFVDPIDKHEVDSAKLEAADNSPTKKSLLPFTDLNFRRFDQNYADSELWVEYGSPEPKQLKEFGIRKAASRFTEWKSEFDQMVASGKMPQLTMLQLCRDHTAGTTPGLGTPAAMVADNDYALGKVVETISHSPFWRSTAIIVLEDDAQNGVDHVDCHRSLTFVISPYSKRGLVDSRFYNTDSVLRTIELLLGMKPMNQYDAVANPLLVFERQAINAEPYLATAPSKAIATAVNKPTAYRAKDSMRLIGRYGESDAADLELNDILWHVAHPK